MRTITAAAIATAMALSFAVTALGDDDVITVGTYDNRAIAIAYANSDLLPHEEKMAELQAAKDAGDEDRIEELEAWGEKHQHKLHLMGFSTAPVTELLALVEDGIPQVAEEAGVDVIARHCDFVGEGVQVVDVTMELVALFEPDQNAYDTIEQMEGVEPVDIGDIRRDH